MSAALKEAPPRGKFYAVARLTLVTSDADIVIERARHSSLLAARRQQASIDHRLQPVVVIVDNEAAA